MNKDRITIPDYITLFRMAGTAALFFIQPFTGLFYVVYSLCGLSDILDGAVARAAGSVSDLGAKLDSVADLMFYSVALFKIMPVLFYLLPLQLWLCVGVVIVVRIGAYTIAALKYKRFASMHTYLNKLTGLAVFFVPYLMTGGFITAYCSAACATAGIASAEELLIHITNDEYNPKVKSLFIKTDKAERLDCSESLESLEPVGLSESLDTVEDIDANKNLRQR